MWEVYVCTVLEFLLRALLGLVTNELPPCRKAMNTWPQMDSLRVVGYGDGVPWQRRSHDVAAK